MNSDKSSTLRVYNIFSQLEKLQKQRNVMPFPIQALTKVFQAKNNEDIQYLKPFIINEIKVFELENTKSKNNEKLKQKIQNISEDCIEYIEKVLDVIRISEEMNNLLLVHRNISDDIRENIKKRDFVEKLIKVIYRTSFI